nr:MAG TPA: hypothetical protein [Caudoviricetes sp.]
MIDNYYLCQLYQNTFLNSYLRFFYLALFV